MRIHWIYLVSSFVLAVIFLRSWKVFSWHYFINPSSFLDLKLFVSNRIVKFFFILPFEAVLIFYLCKQFLLVYGEASWTWSLSKTWGLGVYTLILFIFDDFLRFFQHHLMHKIPCLWEIHKVHHSAHVLTPLTLYRVHVVEVLISSIRRVLGTVLVTCVMMLLTEQMWTGYEIAGVLAFNFIFNFLGGNLRHSHIPLSFGLLDYVFISPAQHQIHHSKNPKHYDKNFGVALSIWDLIFGSWVKGNPKQKIKVGLVYSERNHTNEIISAHWGPVREAWRQMKPKKKENVIQSYIQEKTI